MSERDVVIRFAELSKSFAGQRVLDRVSLSIARGAVHFVMGPSGAGKSVLIKHVVGLLRPDAGRVYFDGRDVTGASEEELFAVRRRCQLIFQHATLFDHLTVLENVAMPARKRFRCRWREAEARARTALARVHASELEARFPPELGRGVQKRVAIARAIALEPEALLYDEPTTGLDPVAARRIDRLIRSTADELRLTSVVVSHDLASLSAIADRVSFLHAGRVHAEDTPAALLGSSDPLVAAFFRGERARWSAPSDAGA